MGLPDGKSVCEEDKGELIGLLGWGEGAGDEARDLFLLLLEIEGEKIK